jgi:hypothetical protein
MAVSFPADVAPSARVIFGRVLGLLQLIWPFSSAQPTGHKRNTGRKNKRSNLQR